jgi:IclR family acetate operon transcriptional repressor
LGWALIYLGRAAAQYYNLPAIVHPFLEQLAIETGETTSLVVLDRDHAIYIDQVTSDNLIKGIPSVGSKLALHCTSAGKVLLGGFSRKDFQRFLRASGLEKKTDKTITKSRALSNEIKKVKRQGYAVDDEETEIGGRCVGAPVFDKEGKMVAAISVIGPSTRIKKDLFGKLSIQVRKAAAQASAALGYEG